jgi:chromate transporter
MLLPGPEAQQLATYIGWLMHKSWGGLIAGGLFVLPSLIILIVLSWIYIAFGDVPLIAGVLYGVKPAVTAIVIQAAHRIGDKALKNEVLIAIAVAAFVAICVLNLPFPLIVAIAGLIGYVCGRWMPAKFNSVRAHAASAQTQHGPALIDDHTPTPPHAQFAWTKLLRVLVIGVLLWATPMGLISLALGWSHTLTQMGWFFTKAAFLTFGGAYAVLSYVYQGAVGHYGWLSGSQMMDGLALGETTPGPLIMVVTFVGFVGGYLSSDLRLVFGANHPLLAGAAAAIFVTWFTFLPSFIFIFAGGPLIESTHNQLAFTAPLTAITAAVVGVIVNLALFFAYHVLWPKGFAGSLDICSALIIFVAMVTLFYFKRSVIELIVGCGVLGMVISGMS